MPKSTESAKSRPAPVRRPKKPTKKTMKKIESLSSSTANNVMSQVLNKFKSFGAVEETKPARPKPVRRPKKPSKKTLKNIQSLSASTANNVMQRTLNEFKKMTAPVQETPAPKPVAKPARPKPVRKPRTVKTFTANIGNPYAINMIMNNPVKKPKKPSAKNPSARKPSAKAKSRSISLNQVTFPEAPQVPAQVPRIMTLNQLVKSNVSLNQAKANASRNAQFFVSAFKARKSAKKGSVRKPRGKGSKI